MKQSGIDWIGEIPDDWKIEKAKHVFRQRFDKGNELTLQLLSPTQKFGVIPQTLYEELTTYSAVKLKEGTDLSTFKTVHKGDFCISLRSFQGGFEYSRYEGVVSPAYQIFYAIKKIDDEYYKYLFKDQTFIAKMNSYTMSLRDGKNIAFSDFGDTFIPLPPKATQQRIAEYLDSKCAQIDSIIDESKKSIEEYKSWKQSVIFEAVTGKKLNCKKKDSGIDTVGMIPVEWELRRLRFLCDIMTGDQDTQDANPDGKYNFYVRSPNVEKSDSYTFEGEGILMAGDGAGAGKVFHHAYGKYAIHQRVYCFYNFRDINTNFFYYYISLLFSIDMEKGSAQSTVPSVRMPMIKDFTFCLPPLHEQEAIAKMLDSKCAQIDSLIVEKESLIADLTEYKKSLIFEVVTGKRSL